MDFAKYIRLDKVVSGVRILDKDLLDPFKSDAIRELGLDEDNPVGERIFALAWK